MSPKMRGLPGALAVAIALACSEGPPTGPTDFAGIDAGVAGTIDVSGEWEWSREEAFTIPAEFAFVFGFEPEGPITHFRCDVDGVMTLVQVGNALSGTEEETFSHCETRGGQDFEQPGLGVLIPIPDGRVAGSTVKLTIGDAEVICPIRAVVVSVEGDVAQALRGTGRCWVPGHPKSNPPEGSPFDLDPPPAGTEKVLVWEATRPG